MPDHRAKAAKCRLATLLGLSWIIIGLVGPVWAGVVNFTELLPFVDMKIPGWTMEGQPCGTTLKQGKVMVSEARVSFKAGDQTLEIIIMDFLGKTIPFLTGATGAHWKAAKRPHATPRSRVSRPLKPFASRRSRVS